MDNIESLLDLGSWKTHSSEIDPDDSTCGDCATGVGSTSDDSVRCTVCLDDFHPQLEADKIAWTKCKHAFCKGCVLNLLDQSPYSDGCMCPLCRSFVHIADFTT